jgi:hypothetical protein
MDAFFFRVEHDLLRSEAFKDLGGSAIKVYLTIGLYADFGTDWAYPSIRTIARQAGLSRQTVLGAIAELTRAGLLATSKSKGRSTAYKIIRQGPERPRGRKASQRPAQSGPGSLEAGPETGPISLEVQAEAVLKSLDSWAQFLGPRGREAGPKGDDHLTREDTTSIPIPGTPFRLSAEGRLLVAVDLQELLTDEGIPAQLAEKLSRQKDPEAVAKVLLNAFYLRSQGKLQNAPGYIRAGIEDGYELLPEVANKLKLRRRELQLVQRHSAERKARIRQEAARAAEDAAISVFLEDLSPEELDRLVSRAVSALPAPIVRHNPTLSNPFVRGKVYELAGGADFDE